MSLLVVAAAASRGGRRRRGALRRPRVPRWRSPHHLLRLPLPPSRQTPCFPSGRRWLPSRRRPLRAAGLPRSPRARRRRTWRGTRRSAHAIGETGALVFAGPASVRCPQSAELTPSMSRARTASAAAVLLAELAAGPAIAQEESAIAEQLFRDGRDLLDRGQTAQACEKFAASERLAPAIGTRLNLALCREKQGRRATRREPLCRGRGAGPARGRCGARSVAHDHGTALAGQLRNRHRRGIDARGHGDQARRHGLARLVLGTEIPLYPGDHELAVTAPGESRRSAEAQPGREHHDGAHRRRAGGRARGGRAAGSSCPSHPLRPRRRHHPMPPAPGPDQRRVAGYAAGGAASCCSVSRLLWPDGNLPKRRRAELPGGIADRFTVYDQAREAQTLGLAFAGLGAAAWGRESPGAHHPCAPACHAGVSVVPALGARAGGLSLRGKF